MKRKFESGVTLWSYNGISVQCFMWWGVRLLLNTIYNMTGWILRDYIQEEAFFGVNVVSLVVTVRFLFDGEKTLSCYVL